MQQVSEQKNWAPFNETEYQFWVFPGFVLTQRLDLVRNMNSIGDTWSEGKSKTGGKSIPEIPSKTYVRKLVWFPLFIMSTLFILTFDFVPSFLILYPRTLMSVWRRRFSTGWWEFFYIWFSGWNIAYSPPWVLGTMYTAPKKTKSWCPEKAII